MSKEKLNLHQGQTDCIKSFINSFQFDNGNLTSTNYLEFNKLDESLLKNKVLQDNFEQYQLGFFIQNLTWKLLSSANKSMAKREKLFKSAKWLDACAKTVIDTIESFPLEYLGSISLPVFTTQFAVNLEITSEISIITSPESSDNNSLLSALMGASGYSYSQTKFLSKTPYVNIKTKGYCDGNINSTAGSEFLSTLKQFLALSLILDIFIADKFILDYEANRKIINSDRATTPHWLMKATTIAPSFVEHMEVPPELAAFINKININKKDLKVYATNPNAKTILSSVYEKAPENDSEFNEALIEKFNKVTTFFNLPNSFDKNRISSSLEWFLEAKSTANQSVSLIYFCIGLEAILGDDSKNKELQLKEKLADRVAYMLGNTNSQRTKLKNDFKDIYSARSDLVHAKEPKISKQKTELLSKAEVMLSFLIRRELNGLIKSKMIEKDRQTSKKS